MQNGRITEGDEQICKMVRSHFSNLRQRQRQGVDLSTTTEDLRFMLKFISNSVTQPVTVLRKMGVINLRRCLAINLDILQTVLVMPRVRILNALYREGWKDDDPNSQLGILPIVGESEVKNWVCLIVPDDTKLIRDVIENMQLTATEANQAQRGDPKEKTVQPRFPMVAIEYERDFHREAIAIEPEPQPAKPKLVMVKLEPLEFRVKKKSEEQ